jgi:hypothetical protein
MQLNFPAYLNKKSEVINRKCCYSEGTRVTWKMNTLAHKAIDRWNCKATFRKQKQFLFIKNISQNTDYQILTE